MVLINPYYGVLIKESVAYPFLSFVYCLYVATARDCFPAKDFASAEGLTKFVTQLIIVLNFSGLSGCVD